VATSVHEWPLPSSGSLATNFSIRGPYWDFGRDKGDRGAPR
jgi:hypothetical protein